MVLPAATKVVAGDMEDLGWFSLWKPMETTGWRYIETGFKQTFGYHRTIVLIPAITCYNML